jgi:hypothetical protein
MSDTPRTIGIARIDVTSSNTVDVTQRVITIAGLVAWVVKNNTGSPHKVCVTNFRAVFPAHGNFSSNFLLQQEHCTDNISAGKTGVILASFSGIAGQILAYDVTIDGTTAADPELEI